MMTHSQKQKNKMYENATSHRLKCTTDHAHEQHIRFVFCSKHNQVPYVPTSVHQPPTSYHNNIIKATKTKIEI